MPEKIPMTPFGYDLLISELHHLKDVIRPEVIKDLATVSALDDVSENAEYQAAQERQEVIDKRISFLEQTIEDADVIDPLRQSGSKVQFGATLTIIDIDSDEVQNLQIVGPLEENIKLRRISIASPLARALLGHEVGDEVKVMLSAGPRTFEILALNYR